MCGAKVKVNVYGLMPSTVITSIEYDAANGSLTIGFVSGLVYVYFNVPEDIYRDFISYREKGVYFNQHIKNKYRFKNIT